MKKWRNKPEPEVEPAEDATQPAAPETPEAAGAKQDAPSDGNSQPADAATQEKAVDVPGGEEDTGAAETIPMERLLRLQADFDNYRKRVIRERSDHIDRATEDLMLELLPVLDHFDIALRHAEEQSTDAPMIEGFRLVAEQLETTLRKFGLQRIESEDVPFDPHQHEAVAHLPDPAKDEGMIVASTRRGYRLGGKLLRAAQVVVSSGSPVETESVEAQEEK